MSERCFVVLPGQLKSELVMLEPAEAAHAMRVLRLQIGDDIWLADGQGQRARAVIERLNPMLCRITDRPLWNEPIPRLVMGLGISKNPAMDLAAQKLTELMVDEIRPLTLTRSVAEPSSHKNERWQRIALQALKQCRVPRSPLFVTPQSIEEFLAIAPVGALKIIAWEDESRCQLMDCLPEKCPAEIWALLGPEGGFTPAEVELAGQHGFIPCRLTASTMRAETAAIVLAGILRCLWPYG